MLSYLTVLTKYQPSSQQKKEGLSRISSGFTEKGKEKKRKNKNTEKKATPIRPKQVYNH